MATMKMLDLHQALNGKSCFHAEAEVKPQDVFPFEKLVPMPGVDKDGTTVRQFDLKAELTGRYFVLLFFPMDFTADAKELRSFASQLKEFLFNKTTVVAVSADNAYTTLSWISKPEGHPRCIGGTPGLLFLSDKDQYLAHLLGVSRQCGTPARAMFLVDSRGHIRYCSSQLSCLPRSTDHLLRLVRAFRHVDERGEVIPVGWTRPGDEVIDHSHAGKLEYFQKKHGAQQDQNKINDVVVPEKPPVPEKDKTAPVKEEVKSTPDTLTPVAPVTSGPAKSTAGPEKSTAVTEKSTTVTEKSTAVAEKSTAVAEKSTAVAEKSTAVLEKSAVVSVKDKKLVK